MSAGHAELKLATGEVALVDQADFARCQERVWRAIRLKGSQTLYVRASGPYTTLSLLHRFIAGARQGEVVDHIDGNGLNNRRQNLRLCTHQQNIANRTKQSNSSQPYKGVRLRTDKLLAKPWSADIGAHSGDRKRIGWFATAEDAARAYDAAAVVRYGEFACLNFPHEYPSRNQRRAA